MTTQRGPIAQAVDRLKVLHEISSEVAQAKEQLRNLAECIAEMHRDTACAEASGGHLVAHGDVAEWLEQEADGTIR